MAKLVVVFNIKTGQEDLEWGDPPLDQHIECAPFHVYGTTPVDSHRANIDSAIAEFRHNSTDAFKISVLPPIPEFPRGAMVIWRRYNPEDGFVQKH